MKLRLSKKSIKLIVDVMQEYEDIMEKSDLKNQKRLKEINILKLKIFMTLHHKLQDKKLFKYLKKDYLKGEAK